VKLVLLDVDGTLVDSARIILDAQVETCAAHGIPHPGRDAGLSVVGLSLPIALAELTGRPELADDLTDTYRLVFNRMRQDPVYFEPLYPGVEATVASLAGRDDVILGIATGKSRRGADYILDRHGWQPHFAVVRTADDGPSKPHPEMILGACRETGIAPQETLMIGDSTFDMLMAKSAGATAIAVSYGFQPVSVLREAGADHVIDSFAGLLDHLPASVGRGGA